MVYPQTNHGGEVGFVQLRPTPGDEHPHFLAAVPGGILGAYEGRDRVDGDTTTQSPLQGAVGDAGRKSEEVAGGSNKGIEGGDDNDKGIENGEQGEQGGYSGSSRNGGYRGGELVNGGGPNRLMLKNQRMSCG